jgi:NTP pyrophosphatase (non-canonical NTP hydrolase)
MTDIEHKQLVKNLVKSGQAIIDDLNPSLAHILHMAVGVSGESGELLDAVKKATIYKKALDLKNVIEELGDLEFYMEGLRSELGISREETLQANINKLSVRYNKGSFSNDQAQARADKAVEA